MLRAVFLGHGGGLFGGAADDRDDLHPVDVLQSVKVLFAKGACASNVAATAAARGLRSRFQTVLLLEFMVLSFSFSVP